MVPGVPEDFGIVLKTVDQMPANNMVLKTITECGNFIQNFTDTSIVLTSPSSQC